MYTTPITTYHIKHAPATSHKNQVNFLYESSKFFIHTNRSKLIHVTGGISVFYLLSTVLSLLVLFGELRNA